jgi:hypothetical protein
MDANIGLPNVIEINRIYRTGMGTVTAVNTQTLFDNDAAAIALGICAGGTGCGTGCRIAGHAGSGFKTGRQPTG